MSGSMGRHLQRSLGVGCKKPKSCPLQLTAARAARIVIQVKQICSCLLNWWRINTLRCCRQRQGCMTQWVDIVKKQKGDKGKVISRLHSCSPDIDHASKPAV